MIKIPQETEFFVSNASDLTPNIQYTKNITLDEAGYIKLSPPLPRLLGSSETANFDTVADIIAIGSVSSQDYKIITDSAIYDLDLQTLTVALDAGAPTGSSTTSRVVGWKGGDWYYNDASDIYSLQTTAGTVWDVENTNGVDYLELFVNRNTIVGASSGGSTVIQMDEGDMNGTTPTGDTLSPALVLPSNFEIRGLSYSNYRIGIATRNTTGGSAYFFVWDGTTASASIGVPVFAPMIIDVVAYKNSWVLLTSLGQLLYFNGGGFDILGNLPPYYFSANWMNQGVLAHGRTMQVDGDVIYFNIGTLLESSDDDSGILQGFYSGAYCYDPAVGIYHRHGLAYSKLYRASTSATSGVFTSSSHKLLSGDKVLNTSGVIYYAIYLTDNTFSLADTYALSLVGTASADFGTASYTLTWIKRDDWTQLTANNTNFGACIKFDNGTNLSNDAARPFFLNLQVATPAMASEYITGVLTPKFDNIGGVTYSKAKAQLLEDMWSSITVKHRPLVGGDKIVVKYKLKDYYKAIGIGEAGDISADAGTANYITWSDSDTFTTTKDLTGVLVGHEVEFMSGAGAGSTAHISSISESAGTWTVSVDEAIRGASSGTKSTCIIDSFVKAGTITPSMEEDGGFAVIRVDQKSKWLQVKLELRGNDIAVEETLITRQLQRMAT